MYHVCIYICACPHYLVITINVAVGVNCQSLPTDLRGFLRSPFGVVSSIFNCSIRRVYNYYSIFGWMKNDPQLRRSFAAASLICITRAVAIGKLLFLAGACKASAKIEEHTWPQCSTTPHYLAFSSDSGSIWPSSKSTSRSSRSSVPFQTIICHTSIYPSFHRIGEGIRMER